MATKNDDIEIVIEPDAPVVVDVPPDETKAPQNLRQGQDVPEPPAEKLKIITPEDGIEQLKANLEQSQRNEADARRQRDEANQRAAQEAQRAAGATKEVRDTNLSLVTNAIETIKMSQNALKTNWAAAMAAGDFDGAADIQLKMSDNSAKLTQLESGKAEMEIASKRPEPQPGTRTVDPVEHIASQLTGPSAAWIRAHPEYARTPDMYQKVIRADAKVWGDGVERDTPEYFERVERALGLRQDAPQRQERGGAPPAAPPSRGSGDGNGGSRQTVRLTPAEMEMAALTGLTLQQYAANKIALRDEGKLN